MYDNVYLNVYILSFIYTFSTCISYFSNAVTITRNTVLLGGGQSVSLFSDVLVFFQISNTTVNTKQSLRLDIWNNLSLVVNTKKKEKRAISVKGIKLHDLVLNSLNPSSNKLQKECKVRRSRDKVGDFSDESVVVKEVSNLQQEFISQISGVLEKSISIKNIKKILDQCEDIKKKQALSALLAMDYSFRVKEDTLEDVKVTNAEVDIDGL